MGTTMRRRDSNPRQTRLMRPASYQTALPRNSKHRLIRLNALHTKALVTDSPPHGPSCLADSNR